MDNLPILRCLECNKPFNTEASLKRHGYYCRSRKSGTTVRLRSCASCVKRKSQCDNRRPKCSRCVSRGVECRYPADTSKKPDPKPSGSVYTPVENGYLTPDFFTEVVNYETPNPASGESDSTLSIQDLDFSTFEKEYLDWNVPTMAFGKSSIVESIENNNTKTAFWNSLGLDRLLPLSDGQMIPMQQQIAVPEAQSIPRGPSNNIRLLVQRPKALNGTQRIAQIMFRTLKSYSIMMLRHDTLPPFIHKASVASYIEDRCMEPLKNCISLMQMISTKNHNNRKLFWKNVRFECERVFDEYQKMNKNEIVAMLQALAIYILTRIDEGETEHNNHDFLLLNAVTVLSKQLIHINSTDSFQLQTNSTNLEHSWKDWILDESMQRICVIYQTLNMLVFFEPASLCRLEPGLLLAPLPDKKHFWEAESEAKWKAEIDKISDNHAAFGLTTDGELVTLQMLSKGFFTFTAAPRETARWEEWCAEIDGLGGLVMLAASLLA